MDYKNMSDSELAAIMVSYIDRVEHLMNTIGMYLNDRNISQETIRGEYSILKNELKKVAHYVGLVKNQQGSDLYRGCFIPSISEAVAEGLGIRVNGKVNQAMYHAVEEAWDKLQKYKSLKEWKKLV